MIYLKIMFDLQMTGHSLLYFNKYFLVNFNINYIHLLIGSNILTL
jgi:hypothetical protein